MDDIVRQAIAKWPNVPHCYGWLGLDARGDWWLRDAAAQALGAFASGVPGARGARLEHEGLKAFIARNYQADERGRWHFQNGPQRVYVELQATPWVWRVAADGALASHTGATTQARRVLLDEGGRLYVDTPLGLGLVHTLDMEAAALQVERGHWQPEPVRASDLPARFDYVPNPQPAASVG